jgi:adenosylmethionine-8-amino-7-oxononanoate aminotransferase
VDEVINGFGRTGKMFAHQHYGVKPDIMAVAKGIVSAYLPIAATVVKNEVFNSFLGEEAAMRQVMQVNTYGGHPAAAAVAVRNIEIMAEENLVTRSAELGAYFMDGLKTLLKHPVVGDVRGKGLLLGVELVKDKKTKEQVSSAHVGAMVGFCRKQGVIIGRSGGGSRHSNTLTFSPPLVITRSEIDRIIDVLDRGLTELGPQMQA